MDVTLEKHSLSMALGFLPKDIIRPYVPLVKLSFRAKMRKSGNPPLSDLNKYSFHVILAAIGSDE